MDDAEEQRRRQQATSLDGDAAQALRVAEHLDLLADEVEGRLEPITAAMTPGTWAGAAADQARHQAYAAADELATAVRHLRAVAEVVRTEAATWQARAVFLTSAEAVPWGIRPEGPA